MCVLAHWRKGLIRKVIIHRRLERYACLKSFPRKIIFLEKLTALSIKKKKKRERKKERRKGKRKKKKDEPRGGGWRRIVAGIKKVKKIGQATEGPSRLLIIPPRGCDESSRIFHFTANQPSMRGKFPFPPLFSLSLSLFFGNSSDYISFHNLLRIDSQVS